MARITAYAALNMHTGFNQNFVKAISDWPDHDDYNFYDATGNAVWGPGTDFTLINIGHHRVYDDYGYNPGYTTDFYGHGFKYHVSGVIQTIVPTGTITAMVGGYDGHALYSVTGINVPLKNVFSASDSATARDDVAVYAKALIGNDKITGSAYGDVLDGFGGSDSIAGGYGNDVLYGNTGNDSIAGQSGNDRLFGGAGNDRLSGGAGHDSFYFDAALSKTTNVDTITDFNPLYDTVCFDNAVMAALGAKFEAVEFWKSASGLAHDANDRIMYETDTGWLNYDSNGNRAGGAVHIAKLAPNLALTAGDFLVF